MCHRLVDWLVNSLAPFLRYGDLLKITNFLIPVLYGALARYRFALDVGDGVNHEESRVTRLSSSEDL